eukprot:scaffold112508_cov61-Phaeocystis_antarctica.AAC.1
MLPANPAEGRLAVHVRLAAGKTVKLAAQGGPAGARPYLGSNGFAPRGAVVVRAYATAIVRFLCDSMLQGYHSSSASRSIWRKGLRNY